MQLETYEYVWLSESSLSFIQESQRLSLYSEAIMVSMMPSDRPACSRNSIRLRYELEWLFKNRIRFFLS